MGLTHSISDLGMFAASVTPIPQSPVTENGSGNEILAAIELIGALALGWVLIAVAFAVAKKMDLLGQLVRDSNAIRFVTVSYIVMTVGVLCILGKMEGREVSTILAGIAGYILGSKDSKGAPGSPNAATEKESGPATDPPKSDEETKFAVIKPAGRNQGVEKRGGSLLHCSRFGLLDLSSPTQDRSLLTMEHFWTSR